MATHLVLTPSAAVQHEEPAAGLRVIYILWSLFWAIMIVVSVQDHVHAGDARLWEPLLWEGTSAAGATVWFALQRRLAHQYDQYLGEPLRWFAEHLKWLPLMIVTFIGGVYAVRHGVYYLVGEQYEHEPWWFVAVYESMKLVLFAGLWLGILFGFSSFAQWRHERQRLALLQRSLAEAQLSQLKAQLRPHFLFNALNTISALMHTDVDRADRLLARLSDLLRSTLQSGDGDRIALRDELHLLELYAQIMQERFVDRVALEWSIAPDACNASVPVLLLQPLLENAFKHGVEKSRERVHIEVRAERRGDELHLLLRNSGALQPGGVGVGLRNCRERLLVMYGEAASLTLTQDANVVAARAVLPFQEHGG
jgi:hypothetical protein